MSCFTLVLSDLCGFLGLSAYMTDAIYKTIQGHVKSTSCVFGCTIFSPEVPRALQVVHMFLYYCLQIFNSFLISMFSVIIFTKYLNIVHIKLCTNFRKIFSM